MTDYQSIVDEIRFAIQSEDCELTDDLRQANAQYIEACREVNRRLRRVGELLDAGLRSEAIQLAEGPPNISDAVATLSFPEVDEWAEVVALYDLPRAEKLFDHIVEQLSEAQLIDQPLQRLLNQHRRLALIRAPLRMRLSVLRQLMKADPETFTWEEDVRTFERACFTELVNHAREAQRNSDGETLQQIHTDLSSGEWLQRPPAKLVSAVKSSLFSLSRRSAREELDQLAEQLEAAFSELDLDRARSLRSRWLDASKRANLSGDEPCAEAVSPVLGWIQDEDDREAAERKYEQTVAQLERALDNDAAQEDLERLEHEVRRLDRGLPDLLATRYQNRIESLRLARTRMHRFQLGSVLAVLLFLAGLAGLLVHRQMRAAEVDRLAAHVEQLIDDRQFEQAETAMKSRSDIMKWDRLLALKSRLDKELQAERDRKKLLQQEFEKVQRASTYAEAVAALEQSRRYVHSTDDKLEFDRLKRTWEDRHNKELAEKQQRVEEGLRSVTSVLVKVDQELENGPEGEELSKLLQDASVTLAKLEAEAAGLRPEFTSQIQLLMSRRQHLDELRRRRLTELERERDLSKSASILPGDPDPQNAMQRYLEALSAYADALGPGPASDEIRQAAGEAPFWRGAVEWAHLTASWQQPWPGDAEAIAARMAACKSYLETFGAGPESATAGSYLAQLRAIEAREGPTGEMEPGLKGRFQRIFENPLIARSWCLKTKDGRVFYLPERLYVEENKLFRFEHFVGYGREDVRGRGDIKPEDLKFRLTDPAPSSTLAEWATHELSSLQASNWNEFMRELALKILAADDMNAFLKMDLLRRTLEAAGEGDIFLREQLASHVKLLQEAPINPLARWMDPDDVEGKKASDQARDVLATFQRLKGIEEVWAAAAEAERSFTQQLRSPLSLVGWLKRTETAWVCKSQGQAQQDCELLTVFVDGDISAAQWRTIGKVRGDLMEINSSATAFLLQGRPVFARSQDSASVAQQQ